MAERINVKLILQLHEAGTGRNAIAATRHISKNSVSDVLRLADSKGICYDQIKDLKEDEVYRLFYPDKFQSEVIYEKPEYEDVHKELSRIGVTLKLLWNEYQDRCRSKNTVPMGYTRFCEGYRQFANNQELTNHLDHKPGERCEVDWSGPTMHYEDCNTGELITVYLFVSCLPYSQYAYVEPTLDMKMNTWIRCHIHMYAYFGGVPIRTVCDNLKTGVVEHPKVGDIVLTEDYEALGTYYVTAIMPAPVRKPKRKASVEGTVGDIATAIIAKLRNNGFQSFEELKKATADKLKEFNDAPFQKREGSRTLQHQEELRYLRPVPEIPYEIASWSRSHTIDRRNFHVLYEKNYYSVPYQYAGQKADLRITDHSIEIFIKGERVTTHNRFPSYIRYQYSTLPEHMPPSFLREEWNKERICHWADQIGPNTREVIDRIFQDCKLLCNGRCQENVPDIGFSSRGHMERVPSM